MKRYLKEYLIFLLQALMFYISPLTAGPTDIIAMVLLMLAGTLIWGLCIGLLSDKKIKYIYPIATSVIFIPSIYIYYNESAWVHTLWHLILASIGLIVGSGIRWVAKKLK